MPLNMDSILAKAQAAIERGGKAHQRWQNTCRRVVLGTIKVEPGSNVHTPEEAATKFMQVLRRSIEQSGLSANAQNAISDFAHGDPIDMRDGTYLIKVYFSGDLTRPSLYPEKYGELNDLAEMLNNGMHARNYVYGTWHGNKIRSKISFDAEHFMEQAVNDFMGNYGTEYNVISCTIGV